MSNKRVKLEINSEIKDILQSKNIKIHDGISCLLNMYYGIDASFVPEELKQKIFTAGIVTKEYSSDTYSWIVPLFGEVESGFEWVTEWMDLFKRVNPDRRGVKKDVLIRMKRFFMNNPAIRKDEVFSATRSYLSEVTNPTFCKKSHKFIYELDGSSMLLDYVERTKIKKETKYDDLI